MGNFWAKRVNGIPVEKEITLSGNNTTVVTPLFTVVGSVRIIELYGVVTTVLGSNQTAAYLRLNDQTAQVDITLASGTTVSSAAVGSILTRRGLAAAAITLITTAAGRVGEGSGAVGTKYFPDFIVVKKSSALTQIEYVYTTTNTPTTGAIKWYAKYLPLTPDGSLTAA